MCDDVCLSRFPPAYSSLRMKFALIFIISLIATTIVADECLDICIRSLGASGCPQGSFCKNGHVCQALHWTTHARSEMCLFGYHQNCPNTFPVSCNEARLLLNTAPLTTGIPYTTTTTPDFNQQIYDLIGGVRSIVRGEYQSDDLVGAVRAITRGEEINRLIRASVDNTIESFVHAANFVGNLGVPVVEYYQDMYCTETNQLYVEWKTSSSLLR